LKITGRPSHTQISNVVNSITGEQAISRHTASARSAIPQRCGWASSRNSNIPSRFGRQRPSRINTGTYAAGTTALSPSRTADAKKSSTSPAPPFP